MKEQDVLFCPECGSEYKIDETVTDQTVQAKYGPYSQTKLISAKKKRKHYDNFGALIRVDQILFRYILMLSFHAV